MWNYTVSSATDACEQTLKEAVANHTAFAPLNVAGSVTGNSVTFTFGTAVLSGPVNPTGAFAVVSNQTGLPVSGLSTREWTGGFTGPTSVAGVASAISANAGCVATLPFEIDLSSPLFP
jgi:hypothetical protein